MTRKRRAAGPRGGQPVVALPVGGVSRRHDQHDAAELSRVGLRAGRSRRRRSIRADRVRAVRHQRARTVRDARGEGLVAADVRREQRPDDLRRDFDRDARIGPRVGSMQDFMLGLHMLAEDGRSTGSSARRSPWCPTAFCEQLGATLVRDDQLFRAAVVGFGSFGIVHAVMFEAAPVYLLEVHRRRIDWPQVRHAPRSRWTAGLGLPYRRGAVSS